MSWIESPESRTERRDVLKELQLQSWTRADSSTQTQHRSSWKHTRTTKPVTVTAFKWIQRAPAGGLEAAHQTQTGPDRSLSKQTHVGAGSPVCFQMQLQQTSAPLITGQRRTSPDERCCSTSRVHTHEGQAEQQLLYLHLQLSAPQE